MSRIDELLKTFKEDLDAEGVRDSSEEILDSNIMDWDTTTIDNDNPGSFENQEITDCENIVKNLDNPLKKDTDEEECSADSAECNPTEEPQQESLYEATMSDIPHEIDDQIHELKDMRFDLEETEKNWNLSGINTDPLDDILKHIDDLVTNMYDNGAKMADDEVGSSKIKQDEEEPSDEEEKDEEESEKDTDEEDIKESRFDSMIREVLTERAVSIVPNGKDDNLIDDLTPYMVREAIVAQLDKKEPYGKSVVVNENPDGDSKCYLVSTNGQELDLPEKITVHGHELELKDSVYYVKK